MGEKIFILSQRVDAQWLLCLEAKDGKELWSTRVGDRYTNEFGDGPRGTPTVSGGSVFALGANGELLCADAATGQERWRAKLTDHGGKIPGWGYSESPLADGARVMSTPGGEKGAVVAFDLKTGQPVWQSKDFPDEAQYTSLMTLEKGGVRQYISGKRERVAGLAADNGRLLWQQKFRSGVVVSQSPIVSGDQICMVAAGGTGCKAVRLTASNAAGNFLERLSNAAAQQAKRRSHETPPFGVGAGRKPPQRRRLGANPRMIPAVVSSARAPGSGTT